MKVEKNELVSLLFSLCSVTYWYFSHTNSFFSIKIYLFEPFLVFLCKFLNNFMLYFFWRSMRETQSHSVSIIQKIYGHWMVNETLLDLVRQYLKFWNQFKFFHQDVNRKFKASHISGFHARDWQNQCVFYFSI